MPTEKQTIQFAEHVAECHSWYKHLPFFPPGACFAFFLDPGAGKGVKEENGIHTLYDIKTGDYFEHHSRLATNDYLDRFGCWAYCVINPRDYEESENMAPLIYDQEDKLFKPLPSELIKKWCCQLTAFLKVGPMLNQGKFHQEREEFEKYALQTNIDPEIERYRQFAKAIAKVKNIGDWGHVFFGITEIELQRKKLLNALLMVRVQCQTLKDSVSSTNNRTLEIPK